MKFFLGLFGVCLLCFSAIAQSPDPYVFTGSLTLSSGQSISFKLVLEKFRGAAFTGYSMTDYEGNDFTKSSVAGTLDQEAGSLTFMELANTETTSEADASEFCYIKAKSLTFSAKEEKNEVHGTFKGVFPSGETCAEGTLSIQNGALIPSDKDEPSNEEPTTNVIEGPKKDFVFTSNETLLIREWEPAVTLEVWDGDVQDHDIVDVYLNGTLFREGIVLKRAKKIIELPEINDHAALRIVAKNEGHAGINTVTFTLKNVKDPYTYVSQLHTGESFFIEFERE